MYRSRYRYRYNIDTVTGHFGKIGTTSARYWTLRYVRHDIKPIPPHCTLSLHPLEPWLQAALQATHTLSPRIFQYARYTETLSTHEQRRKFHELGGLQ